MSDTHKESPKKKPPRPYLKPKRPKKKGPIVNQLLMALLLVALFSAFLALNEAPSDEKVLTLSEVAEEIRSDNVQSIVVRGDKLDIELVDGTEKESKKEREASLTETLVNYGVLPKDLAMVSIEIKNESGFGYWIGQVLPFLFPLLFIILLLWFLSGQVKGAGMKAFNFGQSRARIVDPDKQRITFDDVAGNDSAKEELREVVDFLKNPKKFLDLGATIPKGVILMGAPGTGKTLLARAVAGEAKVPFFHLSGSEFVEMFVGVGASRVRDLFNQAKKQSPAIIFIDEIDAVGRSRGVGIGGGNDEREQTLNQILVEMDGFEPNEKLIVMAATNRVDVLDPALLRPGRFDRRVTLDLPDRKDREAILQVHVRNKKLEDGVDLNVIAQRTPGFSGADLESLMNEAAILAARQDKKQINQKDILDSIDKVLIGPERKSHLHTERERKITAYHEAGHALVSSVLPHADPVRKVSIVARGRAGGYTLKLPDEDRKLHSKKQFIDDIAMSLGGYVAEKLVFDDVTTGPSNDLQVATGVARNMVTKWGMSDDIGPIALDTEGGRPLFGMGVDKRDHSERVEAQIDAEVSRIMHDGLATANRVLSDHRNVLDAIAEGLLESETLEQDAYEAILKKYGLLVSNTRESSDLGDSKEKQS